MVMQVKAEVSGVLEMMKEYLTRVAADNSSYQHLLQSFSEVRLCAASP